MTCTDEKTTPTFDGETILAKARGIAPVLRQEADFANRDYAPWTDALDINQSMFIAYDRPSHLWEWRNVAAMLLGELAGKSLLDYGCGMGEESIYFAKLGAHVTSIDISELGIDTLKRRANLIEHRYEIGIEMAEYRRGHRAHHTRSNQARTWSEQNTFS